MNESELLREVQIEFSRRGDRLFRNNVGQAWAGKTQRYPESTTILLHPGDVVVRRARPLNAGLCVGSGDGIGWRSITITQNMVGRRVALFTTVEVKNTNTKVTKEQQAFVEAVRSSGGIGVIARSVEDAISGVDGWIESLISRG